MSLYFWFGSKLAFVELITGTVSRGLKCIKSLEYLITDKAVNLISGSIYKYSSNMRHWGGFFLFNSCCLIFILEAIIISVWVGGTLFNVVRELYQRHYLQ